MGEGGERGVCVPWQESGVNFVEWVLSFHHVDSGDLTQVSSLGSNFLYLLNHLTRPGI